MEGLGGPAQHVGATWPKGELEALGGGLQVSGRWPVSISLKCLEGNVPGTVGSKAVPALLAGGTEDESLNSSAASVKWPPWALLPHRDSGKTK